MKISLITIFIITRLISPVSKDIEERIEIQSKKEFLRHVSPEEILEYRDDVGVRHVYLFSKPTCKWCKEEEQELIRMSKELPDVEFFVVNCNKYKEYCKKMQIFSVPTIYVFRNYVERKCFDRQYDYLKKFIMK